MIAFSATFLLMYINVVIGDGMLRSYSWLVFCIVVWGSNFVFGKILVQYFSPSMLTMLRLLMIVLFLGVLSFFYRKRRKIERKLDWMMIVLLGVVGVYINQWSFFVGLETADPTTAALILAMTPVLTGFLAAIFLKEKITVRMGIGSFIAIIGIYYVVTNGNPNIAQLVKVDVGFILLAKPITMIEILGSILIVSGVVISTFQRKRTMIS